MGKGVRNGHTIHNARGSGWTAGLAERTYESIGKTPDVVGVRTEFNRSKQSTQTKSTTKNKEKTNGVVRCIY